MFSILNMRSARTDDRRPDRGDRTARARIRDAALARLSAPGAARVSLRAIAEDAGVSPALVVHHFGSLAGLRRACDEHVLDGLRAQVAEAAEGRPISTADFRAAIADAGPTMRYLSRALVDDNASAGALFDELVAMSADYLRDGEQHGWIRPSRDPEARAALLVTFELGLLVLHQHFGRALGEDVTAPAGAERWSRAALELYTHGLLTDDRFLTALTGDQPSDTEDSTS
jgi:TetR/AcrR family transcriptional regulator, regulator of cefoperazone and chloramphenicol sensitivity